MGACGILRRWQSWQHCLRIFSCSQLCKCFLINLCDLLGSWPSYRRAIFSTERPLVSDMRQLTSECSTYNRWKQCATRCLVKPSTDGRHPRFRLTTRMWDLCDRMRRSFQTSRTRRRLELDRAAVCACVAPPEICAAQPRFPRNRSCFSRQWTPIKITRTFITTAPMRIC